MPTLRHHLRRLSWIALLAILSLALAPTISHALASAAGGSAWAEICTPQGTRLVALDDGQPPAPALSFGHLDHCPLCGLSGTALGLPPAAPSVEPPAGLRELVPPLFLQAQRPPFAWRSAQPRGPPAAA